MISPSLCFVVKTTLLDFVWQSTSFSQTVMWLGILYRNNISSFLAIIKFPVHNEQGISENQGKFFIIYLSKLLRELLHSWHYQGFSQFLYIRNHYS